MPKRSVLKCSKCGYESNIIADTCIKCAANLDKICGECGFKNSPFKNFCDHCGNNLAITEPEQKKSTANIEKPKEKKPELEIQSISDTMNDDMAAENTARVNFSPDKACPLNRQPTPYPYKPGKKIAAVKSNTLNIIILSGLAVTLLAILYLIAAPYIPKIKLLIKTKQYLSHLSKANYEEAYKMLSSNSQASCDMETYIQNTENYYSKRPKWRFKEITVFKTEKKVALIKYKLKEGSGAWTDDYLSFVKEGNTWARPYIWNLFKPIDEAFAKSDFSTALYLAQKLNLIDPLDPRTMGYLCSAQYNLGLYKKAAKSCRKTLETSEFYPVGFDEAAKTWYYFQLAKSLKFTKNYEPAFKIYRRLLSNKTASKLEQCQILLTRSDAYAGAKRYNDALKDILMAQTICPPNFQNDLKAFLSYLTGASKKEAIAFAQKSRFKANMPTILEQRKTEIANIAKRLGKRKRRFVPRDKWSAIHLKGPEYRVFLREIRINPLTKMKESKILRIFKVNLWSHGISLESEGN
ncbi:MAG: zinc ribbon domain-containing protein [Elusimicrobiales bacterium]|nr:zinc ribbon domain-containing protein [Elusimicrobiales bacterium]